jgi:hypothetical protein
MAVPLSSFSPRLATMSDYCVYVESVFFWGILVIYKTKVFTSLTKKQNLSDDDLISACREMSSGLFDVDLGGNLYKKRLALGNKGKSGGYRTIIGAVIDDKYFFLYAFTKSARDNISTKEKQALRELAKDFLMFNQDVLNQLVESGELIKVGECHE